MSLFAAVFGEAQHASAGGSGLFSASNKFATQTKKAPEQQSTSEQQQQQQQHDAGPSGKKRRRPEAAAAPSAEQQHRDKKPKKKQQKAEQEQPQSEAAAPARKQQTKAAAGAAAKPAAQAVAKPAARAASQKAGPPADDDPRLPRTVFVGNLPADVKRKAVARFFAPCGAVESVRLRSLPLKREPGSKLPRRGAIASGAVDAEHSGHAYVVFEGEEAVEAALKLNMSEVRTLAPGALGRLACGANGGACRLPAAILRLPRVAGFWHTTPFPPSCHATCCRCSTPPAPLLGRSFPSPDLPTWSTPLPRFTPSPLHPAQTINRAMHTHSSPPPLLQFSGRHVRVDRAAPRAAKGAVAFDPSRSLFVGNLARDAEVGRCRARTPHTAWGWSQGSGGGGAGAAAGFWRALLAAGSPHGGAATQPVKESTPPRSAGHLLRQRARWGTGLAGWSGALGRLGGRPAPKRRRCRRWRRRAAPPALAPPAWLLGGGALPSTPLPAALPLSRLPQDEELIQLFGPECIEAVRIVRDGRTGEGKGVAFVLFRDQEAAKAALRQKEVQLGGRALRLTRAKKQEARGKAAWQQGSSSGGGGGGGKAGGGGGAAAGKRKAGGKRPAVAARKAVAKQQQRQQGRRERQE
jgi:RNA recognition motif-containing protein